MANIEEIAMLVDSASKTATAIAQLSESGFPLTLEQAYTIQEKSIGHRLDRGEKMVGVKMGFTSRAKMVQMGVDDLIWGRLTNAMQVKAGASIRFSRFVHPRIEPEIAFKLCKPLSGEVSLAEARSAVESLAPAMEIIDSRYRNFKFSLSDVVADNSSSSGFVVGEWQDPDTDILDIYMEMSFDGEVVQQGSSKEILDNPWQSLVEASRLAGEAGLILEPGWIVLAGAATAAEALYPSVTVSLDAGELGKVTVKVGDK
ncbi:MAG: fumarylacetoacetate hydrolase family protein [Pseudomonadales bacterium]